MSKSDETFDSEVPESSKQQEGSTAADSDQKQKPKKETPTLDVDKKSRSTCKPPQDSGSKPDITMCVRLKSHGSSDEDDELATKQQLQVTASSQTKKPQYLFRFEICGIDHALMKKSLKVFAEEQHCNTYIANQRYEDFQKYTAILFTKKGEQDKRHKATKEPFDVKQSSPASEQDEAVVQFKKTYHEKQKLFFQLKDELPKGYTITSNGFLSCCGSEKKVPAYEFCKALVEHNVSRWKDNSLKMSKEDFDERFLLIYGIIRARYHAMELTHLDITKEEPWMCWVQHYDVVAAFSFVAILMDQYSHNKYNGKSAFEYAHQKEKNITTSLEEKFSDMSVHQ